MGKNVSPTRTTTSLGGGLMVEIVVQSVQRRHSSRQQLSYTKYFCCRIWPMESFEMPTISVIICTFNQRYTVVYSVQTLFNFSAIIPFQNRKANHRPALPFSHFSEIPITRSYLHPVKTKPRIRFSWNFNSSWLR